MERTIKPETFNASRDAFTILDVRRKDDYEASNEAIPGSSWRDPAGIDQWIGSVPRDSEVVIYCVRGGGVSNSVVDRLQAEGLNARYIEGGIEGLKAAGGMLTQK